VFGDPGSIRGAAEWNQVTLNGRKSLLETAFRVDEGWTVRRLEYFIDDNCPISRNPGAFNRSLRVVN
jgi:hypothetical protein